MINQITLDKMKKERTTTLVAAYRTLKTVFGLFFLPHDLIPKETEEDWNRKRINIMIEVCYDIYDKFLLQAIKDYKKGLLSLEEQRMLARTIKLIDDNLDFYPSPWESDYRLYFQGCLKELNNYRETVTSLIANFHISDIAKFKKEFGDFLKGISPDTQFLEDHIVLKVKLPKRNNVNEFDMTILEENGQLIVSPIVPGPFFYHLDPKKVNIETGEVMNKIKYDLFNYTLDIAGIE